MAEYVYLDGVLLRGGEMLLPGEAAAVLGISERRLRRLAALSVVPCWPTPTGQRRYMASDVLAVRRERKRRKTS